LIPSLPSIVAAPPSTLLSEALPKLQFDFIHLVEVVLECPADPFFRCPAGLRAWRSRRRAVRVTEHGVVAPCTRSRDRQVNHYVDYVKWTTSSTMCIFLDSPSTTFMRERNPHYRSSRVSLRCYHLVDVLG
jgi:hypothetical protein